jgi:O-acetyl-ADP-ribose deacetylase
MTIKIITGDITEQETDAIVNAANESLMAGSGVCGAIHQVAGAGLAEACKSIGSCPTGSAVITQGYNLKAKYVIHAVGPRWYGGEREEAINLESCYNSIFRLAIAKKFKSISIPAISTGVYNYPLDKATKIALKVAREYDFDGIEIRFVCFTKEIADFYEKILIIT